MATQANAAEILIGSGKLYFDRFDANGNPTGLRFLGNASKFGVTPSVTTTKVKNYTRRTRETLAVLTTGQEHTFQLVLMEASPKNVALGLNGDSSAFTQAGGTVTDEVVASTTVAGKPQPVVDMIVQTAQRNISAVTVKATTASTPSTLVAGTDYEIEDATTGLIRILPGATLPGGVTGITVSYTAAALLTTAGKSKINAASVAQSTGKLVYIGDNVSGRQLDLEAWKAVITPSSEINWISDDPINLTLDGEFISDAINHPAEPYYRLIER